AQIAKLLRNIAAAYTIKDEQKFRFQIIAYQKAADAIANSSSEVRDLLKEAKLDTLPGIGPTIKSHLEELFKTGRVKHFEWVLKNVPPSVFSLIEVPSFGPKKAYRLVKEFNLNNKDSVIDQVLKLAKAGKIAKLDGFGEKSQKDIIRAITEYRLGRGKTSRMVLPFAFEIAEKVISYLKTSPAVIEAHPLGSLRRMMSTVGDIDIAVSTNKPAEVIKHFISYPYQERIIEKGDTTASILVSGGKQVDLMTQPPQSFGSLLQHFTGSKNHNIRLREYALKKRLSLSEYGIKNRTGEIKKYASEKTFYEALGMEWIPPEIREDTGEIELAAKHKLPKLIELNDIKGDLHIHSNFPIEPSHDMGQNSFDEMIKKAIELGYEYIGFSEHNPSLSKHTKQQIYNILRKRKETIEKLKKAYQKIAIINLLEVDILTNGKLAIDDKAFSLLDAAIVSIHSSFGMNKKEMTKRVLSGLSHPKAKILAHPTGRLLNERPGYELDFAKIFAFCKKNNKALEINGWPTRLDLPDIIVRQAVNEKVKMLIDTDSHALWQMDLMRYGVSVAKRGWASPQDIVNTWGFTKFSKWLTI
ncbi:MAG: DNA polymerase/3'-5' exonuclease PolX, partial [Candidatus Levybacteria bacterium]|nr:DNA polymerase/3'-5' exonuclease PolX [Candidatus Levybacteria bacterium]